MGKPADKMYLAAGITEPCDTSVTHRNSNLLLVGSTGSGKTASCVEPEVYNAKRSSLLLSVAKKEQAREYSEALSTRGYGVVIMDLANPSEGTVGFDPLAYVENSEGAMSLAKAIIGSPSSRVEQRDPYWDDSATLLIAAEISAVLEEYAAEEASGAGADYPSMLDVLKLHEQLEFSESPGSGFTRSTLDGYFQGLERASGGSFAYRCWRSVKGLAAKTVSCILSTVSTAYSQVFTPRMRELVGFSITPDFAQLGRKKMAVVLLTSPVNKAQQRMANIVYSTAFSQLFEEAAFRGGVLPVPVRVICDDFACGAKIPQFEEYISIMRSTGVSVVVAVQSLAQLKSMYGDAGAITVQDNCDNVVYFGGLDIETASQFARRVDVPTSVMLSMPVGKVVVCRRGTRAVVAERCPLVRKEKHAERQSLSL